MDRLSYKRCQTHSQRINGGARLNALIVISLIAAAAYAGINYVPVAYQAAELKTAMQETVDRSVALGRTPEFAEAQLKKTLPEYDVPQDAVVRVQRTEGQSAIEASVRFTRPVMLLPGYTYQFKFDHTAKTGGFLVK